MGKIACPRCKNLVPVSQVRYQDSNHYTCVECAHGVVEQNTGRGYDVSVPTRKDDYLCDECGFVNSVARDTVSEDLCCGYCDSRSLRKKGNEAAKLLADEDFDTVQ